MRKTYPLHIEGRHPDRVLDAVKHDIRKYLKRERRRDLPAGADYWDFDCRFGLSADAAQSTHLGNLITQVDAAAKEGAAAVYVEILARPALRSKSARPAAAPDEDGG